MYNYRRAICYSGYRENQGPNLKIYPTYEQVKEDLLLLSVNFDIIRMYDPYEHAKTVLECIRKEKIQLKVMLGMDLSAEYNNKDCPWICQDYSQEHLDNNKKHNDNSLKELIKLANEYSDIIEFVAAGNEARPSWGDNLVTQERIVYFINELKKNVSQPVSYCEGFDLWLGQISDIYEAVDFLSVHIYPMWNKVSIKDALEYTIDKFEEVKKGSNKPVIITEAGWTTSCTNDQMLKEDATLACQKEYINGLVSYAKQTDSLVFLFEAFDEPWKGGGNPLEAEKHWGIYGVDRNPKW